MNPGDGSFQSEKVRIGTRRRTDGVALARPRAAADRRASGSEEPIDRGGARTEQSCTDLLCKLQVAEPLQCIEQNRCEGLEPLAADTIGGLPEHNQRFADRLIVKPPACTGRSRWRPAFAGKDADRVLAMVARYRDELIENALPLGTSRGPVPLGDRLNQFPSSCHAHLSPHQRLPPLLTAVAA